MISRVLRKIKRGITHIVPSSRFMIWSLRHPGGTFQEFYAETVVDCLHGKKGHNSLGPNVKQARIESAQQAFGRLIERGVRPGDIFVDYGCGTLRLGKLFIDYLEADRYFGLDIDERILGAGRGQLSPDVLAAKRPVLEVISPKSLARIADKRPRWVCSKGVLQHVPPDQLDSYFASLATLMDTGATGFLNAKLGSKKKRITPRTWVYEFERLQDAAARRDLESERVTKTLISLKRRLSNATIVCDGAQRFALSPCVT